MGTALNHRRRPRLNVRTLGSDESEHCVLARQRERATIAMDLHDNTIQALHGAVMSLAAVERSADAELEQMPSAVHQVRGQLNTTIRELRQHRAARLGASLRVSSGANGGTQVCVELPPRDHPC